MQAGRLPNPRIALHRVPDEHHYKFEQALSFNIWSLVTMPLATEVEQRRFAGAQQRAILEVLRLASDTRKAWVAAVAAEESLRYMRQVRLAADAGAELAARMAKAGNWSTLERAREQGFYADAALAAARAEQAASSTREQLTRLLGLWGEQAAALALPERLPELPATAQERPDIEREAMARRLDVRAAVLDTQAVASNLGLTRATRFVNVLEIGVSREQEGRGEPWVRGYEIALELPLFDFGTARVARAETVYRQSLDRAAQTAIDARSEVREAYRHYRLSHDIARHYRDEIVPLQQAHRRGEPAALQRHADRRLRPAGRRARADRERGRRRRGAARLLDGRGRPAAGDDRPHLARRPWRRRDAAGPRPAAGTERQGTDHGIATRLLPYASLAGAAIAAVAVSRVALAALPSRCIMDNGRHAAAARPRAAAAPTTRWSRSTAGPCPGA